MVFGAEKKLMWVGSAKRRHTYCSSRPHRALLCTCAFCRISLRTHSKTLNMMNSSMTSLREYCSIATACGMIRIPIILLKYRQESLSNSSFVQRGRASPVPNERSLINSTQIRWRNSCFYADRFETWHAIEQHLTVSLSGGQILQGLIHTWGSQKEKEVRGRIACNTVATFVTHSYIPRSVWDVAPAYLIWNTGRVPDLRETHWRIANHGRLIMLTTCATPHTRHRRCCHPCSDVPGDLQIMRKFSPTLSGGWEESWTALRPSVCCSYCYKVLRMHERDIQLGLFYRQSCQIRPSLVQHFGKRRVTLIVIQ